MEISVEPKASELTGRKTPVQKLLNRDPGTYSGQRGQSQCQTES